MGLERTRRAGKSKLPQARTSLVAARFTVGGLIQHANGPPVAGVLTRVYDLDLPALKRDELLGETRTDKDGRYQITYTADQFRRAEKGRADLLVRVFDDNGEQLAASPTIFNAKDTETVNLVIATSLSEYERLMRDIAPVVGNLRLAALKEDDYRFLAGELRTSRHYIRFLVEAERLAKAAADLSEEHALRPGIFYGFLRQKLSTNLDALLVQHPHALRHALIVALRENVIPAKVKDEIADILVHLKYLRARAAMKDSDETGRPTLGKLLSRTITSRNLREEFVTRFLGHEDDKETLWSALRGEPAFAGKVADIQLTLKLAELTHNQPSMVDVLKASGVKAVRDLADRDESGWLQLIDAQSVADDKKVPADVPGERPADKKTAYAHAMAQFIADAVPTAVFAERLKRDRLPGMSSAAHDDLTTFLAHNPDFDLRKIYVQKYLATNAAALAGVVDRQGLTHELKRVQRLFKVTPRFEEVRHLMEHGLDSARAIARMGRRRFVKLQSTPLPDPDRLYDAAVDTAASALTLFAKHSPVVDRFLEDPNVLPVIPKQRPAAAANDIPNWDALFGSLSYCACEDCRSVYSPAAYLVDLLHFFLDQKALHLRKTLDGGTTQDSLALDVLFGRRPDIEHIELSCANTNTRVPYVDLVNEVLENAVAPRPADEPWPQTAGDAEAVLVNPEHLNAAAYDVLSTRCFPLSLPFNLWVEEARAYLASLGMRRHEVMETFRRDGVLAQQSTLAIAIEYLGMTTREREIITGVAQEQGWELWGYVGAAGWVNDIRQVPNFLQSSGLSYEQLRDLLSTQYIRGQVNRVEITFGSECDVNTAVIDPVLDAAMLGRALRFLRLSRRLGWTPRELDQAISVLGAADLDDAFLAQLSSITRLLADLKVPLTTVLAWWGRLDTGHQPGGTAASPSLYDQLFLNKALTNPTDDYFALNDTRTELAVVDRAPNADEVANPNLRLMTGHADAIVAALGITGKDLTRILGSEFTDAVGVAHHNLNLAHLSHLYRVASLARALRLPIADFLTLSDLIGANHPFDNEQRAFQLVRPFDTPAHTWEFVEKAHKVRASRFGINELDYLLRRESTQSGASAPTEAAIRQTLDNLRRKLQAVIAETTVRPDPVGEVTKTTLAFLEWDSSLIEQIVATLGGQVSYDAPLAALEHPVFPPELASKVSYDDASSTLRFTGIMTLQERTSLENVLPSVPYQTAVGQLFDAPRLFVAARMRAFVLPTFKTALNVLPASVVFPTELKDVAYYDPAARELCFGGAMMQTTKRVLSVLSDDPLYLAAIDALYNQPFAYVPDAGNEFWTAADTTQLFDTSATAEERYERALTKLTTYLRPPLMEKTATETLAATLRLSAPTTSEMLTKWVISPANPGQRVIADFLSADFAERSQNLTLTATDYPDQFRSVGLLHKIATVLMKFRVSTEQLTWLFDYGPGVGWLNLNSLVSDNGATVPERFAAWERLVDLFQLRDQLNSGESVLSELFALARRPDIAEDGFLHVLSARTGWPLAEIGWLHGADQFAFSFPADYRAELALLRLRRCLAVSDRLGAPTRQCAAWAKADLSAGDSRIAKQSLKAKYDRAQWAEVARPISDSLRDKQRTALVSYLTAPHALVQGTTFRDENELFNYFLIDVGMNSCQLTTRINQAIGSAQLFIQRCFMNLEEAGSPVADEDWDVYWKWMKNYRVWEANRKVFLYPENWIEPELRDDKSPFFKDLESTLLQDDLTHDTAETAFREYLDKLDAVARLEVCGMYHDRDGRVLHVFGRTFDDPHVYYHRQWVDEARWSAWQRVDADIEGDHLIPVVWNGSLLVFWPIFTVNTVEQAIEMPATGDELVEPRQYWTIQLAWSEYRNHKWSPKTVSSSMSLESLDLQYQGSGYKGKRHFAFKGILDAEELVIRCYRPIDVLDGAFLLRQVGRFRFKSCHGTPVIGSGRVAGDPGITTPRGTVHRYMRFVEDTTDEREEAIEDNENLYFLTAVSPEGSTEEPILTRTPGTFSVLYPHQTDQFFAEQWQALFYQDFRKTFLITVREEAAGAGAFGFLSGVRKYYRFRTFYHPYVCEFIAQINRQGIDGLLQRELQLEPQTFSAESPFNFNTRYHPDSDLVDERLPVEDVDFTPEGAYSQYNWELFFHAPLLIADRLSKNQRFEEARQWFHYIFDPTDHSNHPVPKRFWKTREFFKDEQGESLQELMRLINEGEREREKEVEEWRQKPFNPHLIARSRTTAYQKTVVMKYIDNLIAWGDQLFRRESLETLNQATLLYVLAAEMLGQRPPVVPAHDVQDRSYRQLAPLLDDFSNALVEIENLLPAQNGDGVGNGADLPPVLEQAYFCIPPNDKLLRYWRIVAERLHNIRHCKNIEGVVRELPAFEPAIDPALLVRAAAAGVDIGVALNDSHAPLPRYRFTVMQQKASELCSDVRALGAALLAALEKRDAEGLALLQASHQRELLDAVRDVKEKQIRDAEETLESLSKAKEATTERHKYYAGLQFMTVGEMAHLELVGAGMLTQTAQVGAEVTAGVLHLIPNSKIGAPTSVGLTFGGENLASSVQAFGSSQASMASLLYTAGSLAATVAGHQRRWDEWKLQEMLAQKELLQIERQIAAADLRKQIAERELENHDLQVEQANEVDDYMRGKYTNQELFNWMAGQTSQVYFQSYQLAYDVAKRAERAYRFELGVADTSFVRFGYWDGLKKGLLAGERLHHDLKRMEVAYLDQNRREYEITKRVSLVLHDPLALITLKSTGRCEVELPEALFDADYPGHYMRRLKSVSLTVPCVVGPYTSINCTLTLLTNKTRIKSAGGDSYPERQDGDDERFATNFAALQSIATSHAQNDSGMFELNFRDDRYLPFEGAGAVSRWRIEMPKDCNAFDFETIADVIMGLNYTARDGGEPLRDAAREAVIAAPQTGRARFFSARHEFPAAWHKFLHPRVEDDTQTIELDLSQERFPFQFRGWDIEITEVELFMILKDDVTKPEGDVLSVSLTPPEGNAVAGMFQSADSFMGIPHAVIGAAGSDGTWVLAARKAHLTTLIDRLDEPDAIHDIIVVCHYSATNQR